MMEKMLSKSVITAIPGIGAKYAKRLDAVGIKKPRDLLKQYEKLDKDPTRFVHWMKKQCQANSGHAKKTFNVVSGFNLSGTKDSKAEKSNETQNGNAHKKFSIVTAKQLFDSAKNVQRIIPNDKVKSMDRDGLLPLKIVNESTSGPLTTSIANENVIVDKNDLEIKNTHDDKENGGKDALNQHLLKLRAQFSTMHDSPSQKMLELQSELGKMQHMAHEFDVLAEFLTSEEKLSIFEQNLDRLQKTVSLTEEKIHEINTNNQKMGRMIRQINDTAKKQHENNDKAIGDIGEILARWETKLDRVARKIAIRSRIDVDELKVNRDDYGPLKNDIEHMLNERMTELSTDLDQMKNVVFCIIALIVLKMFVFDLFKD